MEQDAAPASAPETNGTNRLSPSEPTIPAGQSAPLGTPSAPPVGAQPLSNTPPPQQGWRLAELVPILITAINGIGWLVLYLLVLAPQAEQNKAQARILDEQLLRLKSTHQSVLDALEVQQKGGQVQLDDSNRRFVELQIARLEAATVRLEDQLANLRTRTQATTDLNTLRQSLRPNISFGKFSFEFPHPEHVDMEHEIKNIGANAAIVGAPNIRLSLKPIDSGTKREDLLIAGEDFRLNVYRPGMFQPGASNRIDYKITLLNSRLRGSTVHYSFEWPISTDAAAISNARKILGAQISAPELTELSTFTQTFVGTITFAR